MLLVPVSNWPFWLAGMRQRNTDVGKDIKIGITIDFDVFAIPVDEAGEPMRQIEAQETATTMA
jgi:hypothetical protein